MDWVRERACWASWPSSGGRKEKEGMQVSNKFILGELENARFRLFLGVVTGNNDLYVTLTRLEDINRFCGDWRSLG